MKKSMVLFGLSFVFSFISFNAFSMMPVFDALGNLRLMQQLKQDLQSYQQLLKQYDNMKHRLAVAKEIKSDAEGHYGYGDLLNSVGDLRDRKWSPGSWNTALAGLSGGNPERYHQLLSAYKHANPTLSKSAYQKGASDENTRVYEQQVKTNQAVAVNSTYSFNNIQHHLDDIHRLSSQIETAKNEKAATDLNTRMQAESAYLQVQMLKQMVMTNEQMARSRADVIASETAAARFNRTAR